MDFLPPESTTGLDLLGVGADWWRPHERDAQQERDREARRTAFDASMAPLRAHGGGYMAAAEGIRAVEAERQNDIVDKLEKQFANQERQIAEAEKQTDLQEQFQTHMRDLVDRADELLKKLPAPVFGD